MFTRPLRPRLGSVLLFAWLANAACGTIGVELRDLPVGGETLDADLDERFDAGLDEVFDAGISGDASRTLDGGQSMESGRPIDAGDDPDNPPTCEGPCSPDSSVEPGDGDGEAALPDASNDASDDVNDASPPDAREPTLCEIVPAPASPLVHLRFDETSGVTANDSVGTRHGSLFNTASNWTTGQIAGALRLDGSDDYVSLGAVGTARSIVLWLYSDSYGVSSDQTGFRSPSATGSPKNEWTNPSLAYADDGQSAVAPGLISRAQDWASFGLNVPSAVTGLEVRLDMQTSGLNLLSNVAVSLSWNAGANYTATCTSSQILSLGGTLYNCGSASDRWGRTWSSPELSNQNFRVRVSFGGVLAMNLDHLAVNAHYAPYTEGRHVLGLNATTYVAFSGQDLVTTGFPAGTLTYIDGAPGATVGAGWHQLVITSPTAIAMNSVTLGRSALAAPLFHGRLDDFKIYTDQLPAAEVDTLFEHPECVP